MLNIKTILLDDDKVITHAIKSIMAAKMVANFEAYNTIEEFFTNLTHDTEVVVIDYYLSPAVTGRELLGRIRLINEDVVVIVISGQQDYRILIECINDGIFKYVDKGDRGFIDNLYLALVDAYEKVTRRKNVYKNLMKLKIDISNGDD